MHVSYEVWQRHRSEIRPQECNPAENTTGALGARAHGPGRGRSHVP